MVKPLSFILDYNQALFSILAILFETHPVISEAIITPEPHESTFNFIKKHKVSICFYICRKQNHLLQFAKPYKLNCSFIWKKLI